ncbi:MAG TPA: RloB family protein [Burkholderiaceae bacterium]|nr:RloB family protein [Burkholderiaceae bacterium]
MARDHSPRERQRLQLERKKQGQRANFERILIVSEGSKTEPLYFNEIRIDQRIPTTNIAVVPSAFGTEPLQVVKYARQLFECGDSYRSIEPRAFERVFAVFDRDDHRTYFDALKLAESLNNKLRNDDKQPISFQAVASIPSFALWLLLHYEDIGAPLRRDEVMQRLKRHLVDYEKGQGGIYASTRKRLTTATQRAARLAAQSNAYADGEPYTGIPDVINVLLALSASN